MRRGNKQYVISFNFWYLIFNFLKLSKKRNFLGMKSLFNTCSPAFRELLFVLKKTEGCKVAAIVASILFGLGFSAKDTANSGCIVNKKRLLLLIKLK
jgi:hypothetical protein